MKRFKIALVAAMVSVLSACAGGQNGTSPAGIVPKANNGPKSPSRPLDTIGGGPLSLLRVLAGDSAPQLGGRTLAHLYLGIWRIDVSSNGQTGTLASFGSPNLIDVLAYQGNTGAQVASNNVASQTYSNLTFVVDIASSRAEFTDGTVMPLGFLINTSTRSTVGAGSSTTTIADGPNAVDIISNQAFTVPSGDQAVRVDFNAFESLAMSNGALVTNPALFLAPTATVGQIQGTVVNKFGHPVQNATVVATGADGKIGNTVITDASGNFSINTLNAGSYKLSVYNYYTNAAGQQYQASGQSNSGWAGVYGPTVTVTGGNAASAGSIND